MPDYTLHRRCADYIACNTPPINSDLSIAKEAQDSTGAPLVDYLEGETVTFILTATNNGTDDEPNAVVTDVLPACVTLVSHTPSVGAYDASTGEWVIGPMSNGDVQTLELEVLIGACKPDNLVNVATISGDNPDSVPSNNEDSTDHPPRPTSLTAVDDGPFAVLVGVAHAGIDLCANDVNPEGTAIGDVTSVCGQAITPGGNVSDANGTYALAADGCTLVYTASAAAVDTTVTCAYQVTDAEGDVSSANVSYTVTGLKPTRNSVIDDSDPFAVTFSPTGSLRCDGSPFDGADDCFTFELYGIDACRTYDTSGKFTGVNSETGRIVNGSKFLLAAGEVCDSTITWNMSGSAITDAGDQTLFQAAFSASGGVITGDKNAVDDVMYGADKFNAPVGSGTNYYAAVGIDTGFVPLTAGGDSSLPYSDGIEWCYVGKTITEGAGGTCPGVVSEDNTDEFVARKCLKWLTQNSLQLYAKSRLPAGSSFVGGSVSTAGFWSTIAGSVSANNTVDDWALRSPAGVSITGQDGYSDPSANAAVSDIDWDGPVVAPGHYNYEFSTVNNIGLVNEAENVYRVPPVDDGSNPPFFVSPYAGWGGSAAVGMTPHFMEYIIRVTNLDNDTRVTHNDIDNINETVTTTMTDITAGQLVGTDDIGGLANGPSDSKSSRVQFMPAETCGIRKLEVISSVATPIDARDGVPLGPHNGKVHTYRRHILVHRYF